jgi:hypothetical protein
MVHVGGEPGFLPGSFLQQPFRGLGPLGLEVGPQVPGPVPLAVQVLPGMPGAVVGGGDVRDAQVNAEEPGRAGGFRLGDVGSPRLLWRPLLTGFD